MNCSRLGQHSHRRCSTSQPLSFIGDELTLVVGLDGFGYHLIGGRTCHTLKFQGVAGRAVRQAVGFHPHPHPHLSPQHSATATSSPFSTPWSGGLTIVQGTDLRHTHLLDNYRSSLRLELFGCRPRTLHRTLVREALPSGHDWTTCPALCLLWTRPEHDQAAPARFAPLQASRRRGLLGGGLWVAASSLGGGLEQCSDFIRARTIPLSFEQSRSDNSHASGARTSVVVILSRTRP